MASLIITSCENVYWSCTPIIIGVIELIIMTTCNIVVINLCSSNYWIH